MKKIILLASVALLSFAVSAQTPANTEKSKPVKPVIVNTITITETKKAEPTEEPTPTPEEEESSEEPTETPTPAP